MDERAKRKLSAILSADVKGYSRLMREDELSTVRTLEAYREVMTTIIQRYRGRVVDSPGDNLLAEFASVVDAVESAVEIQEKLKSRNDELPENRRMPFRIGINLGDVIEEGERIYGDGVNIAARVEGLAEAGGICVSGTVFEHVKDKLGFGYEYLGEQEVKNIPEPVRIYRVRMEPEAAGKVIGDEGPKPRQWRWAVIGGVVVLILVAGALAIWNFYLRPPFEPASKERMAFPLPDKPSIAVLPFDSLSADPGNESLADRISESIIYTLSYLPDMLVISRNSTFVYKGKPVKIRKVAEDLGVRFVLEGSVMRKKDRVRVIAQLIDASTGYHVWSGRYDRPMKDFLNMLDEITKTIAIELQVKISDKWVGLTRKTNNFEAWAYVTKAYGLVIRLGKENIFEAHRLTEKAVELDPNYGFAWGTLAVAHTLEAAFGYSKSPAKSLKLAAQLNEKSLKLDPTLSCVTGNRGQIYRIQGKIEEAIAFGEKAIAMGPSLDTNYALLSGTMRYAGRFEESTALMKKAMRLNPFYPVIYLAGYGSSLLAAKRYEEALHAYDKLLDRAQKGDFAPLFAHLGLCAAYAELGNEEEARVHVSEIMKLNPNFSVESARKIPLFSYRDPQHSTQWLSSLRKAGLPETPPLPLPDKPSIAVLPFVNMSGDPGQEYFSDGITEEIITALSKVPHLFVIARNSAFSYKGKSVWIPKVGRELGVEYVLEGSVRKAGDKVRITAQLIDAKTGHHLWADRYDRALKDIFALQDEITKKIVTSLHVTLTMGDDARVFAKSTNNFEAYLKLLEGTKQLLRHNRDANILARQLLEEAVSLDPNYARAYGTLAWTYLLEASYGWSKSRQKSLDAAYELAQKTLALDDSLASPYMVLSSIHLQKGEIKEAIALRERGVSLEPSSANNHALLGIALLFKGERTEEAIKELKIANRLDPFPPNWILHYLGAAYRVNGDYDKAIKIFKKVIKRSPDYWLSHLGLAACYGLQGREGEAQVAAAEVFRIRPKFSLAKVLTPYRDKADKERTLEVLHKAGLN